MGATVVYDPEGLSTDWKDTVSKFDALSDSDRESADKTHLSLAIYHGVCAGLAVLTEESGGSAGGCGHLPSPRQSGGEATLSGYLIRRWIRSAGGTGRRCPS